MQNTFRLLLLLLLGSAGCRPAWSQVVLPQLFQSGMVLQREKPIPLWGKAAPGEQVTVTWRKRQYTTTADAEGRWRINLPSQKAGGPYAMEIQSDNPKQAEPIMLDDILVGDVWLCSGQSNIDVTIERVYPQYVDEIEHFDLPKVRLFRVPNQANAHSPQDDILPTTTNWKPLNKQNAWGFSAVGTFLGQRMWQKTKVPQGIIVNSWGGTPIEAWISADSLQRDYPLMVEKTRLYDNPDMIAAQQRANQLADQRWQQLLDSSDPGIAGQFASQNYDDTAWPVVDQYSMEWAKKNGRGIVGSIWLRQHIHIDKAHAGQPARLLLGTLFDADRTFLNGREIGRTYYQYPPRRYDIAEGLLREGDNVLTVRFINKYGTAHFIPEKPYMLCFGPDRFSQNPLPQDTIALSRWWRHHEGADMPTCPAGDVSLQNMPTTLYNSVLHPLAPYALSGVVWYQGESNTGNPCPYGDLLTKMMGCWRDLWNEPQMPFCIVQLANFMSPSKEPQNSQWARLREEQRRVAQSDERAELAVINDLGESVDIHPLRKREVAERIGLCMDRLVYRQRVTLSPQVVKMEQKDNSIVLTLDQPVVPGLIHDMELSADGQTFKNAEARAEGQSITINTGNMPKPVRLRYAWKDNPIEANIRSLDGLPMSSFECEIKY